MECIKELIADIKDICKDVVVKDKSKREKKQQQTTNKSSFDRVDRLFDRAREIIDCVICDPINYWRQFSSNKYFDFFDKLKRSLDLADFEQKQIFDKLKACHAPIHLKDRQIKQPITSFIYGDSDRYKPRDPVYIDFLANWPTANLYRYIR